MLDINYESSSSVGHSSSELTLTNLSKREVNLRWGVLQKREAAEFRDWYHRLVYPLSVYKWPSLLLC
jgi:hypothetical protein